MPLRLRERGVALNAAPAATAAAGRLAWVDAFIANVRPHVVVRAEDGLLIRMPNVAHKLNPTGVRILSYLLAGGDAAGLAERLGGDPERIEQTARFLHGVRLALSGELREGDLPGAVECRPLEPNFSALPVLAEVAVTERCNLACVFCYGDCPGRPGSGPTLETLERIFEVIARDARVPSVSLTGGEPCLRPDLPAVVAAARAAGLRVNLITNGTRVTPALAEALAAAGLASAQVSLEGADAALHDAVTGVSGAHAAACAGVRALDAAGIPVHTNTTLNRLNLAAAPLLPRFARDVLGRDRLSMNLVIPTGAALGRPDLLVRYREIGPVVRAVQEAAAAAGIEFMWYSPTPLCLFNPITAGLGNKGCSACDGLLSVDAAGNVLPCSSWPEPVGPLLGLPFRDLWGGRRAAALRAKAEAPPGCARCDSFAACHGACPLYFRRFGTAEIDPHRPPAEGSPS